MGCQTPLRQVTKPYVLGFEILAAVADTAAECDFWQLNMRSVTFQPTIVALLCPMIRENGTVRLRLAAVHILSLGINNKHPLIWAPLYLETTVSMLRGSCVREGTMRASTLSVGFARALCQLCNRAASMLNLANVQTRIFVQRLLRPLVHLPSCCNHGVFSCVGPRKLEQQRKSLDLMFVNP